jgi:hypothetical protein
MVPRWQSWRLRSFAKRGSTCCRLEARRLHPPSRLLKRMPGVPDASLAPSAPIARACRWRPDAVAPIRCPAPRGRCSRPAEGILDHLDALYALAYLNSGDPGGRPAGGHQCLHRRAPRPHRLDCQRRGDPGESPPGQGSSLLK